MTKKNCQKSTESKPGLLFAVKQAQANIFYYE